VLVVHQLVELEVGQQLEVSAAEITEIRTDVYLIISYSRNYLRAYAYGLAYLTWSAFACDKDDRLR
jgi:acetaldehyde dehydrogenase (acetylating)